MIPPLEVLSTESQDLELIQQNTKRFAKPLEDCPLLDGRLIEGIAVGVGMGLTLVVNHRLGRQPRGWFQVDGSPEIVGRMGRAAWDSRTITFTTWAGVATTIALWVF